MLEEEFPSDEDDEDLNEETEDAASDRLEMEIADRYVTDENSVLTVTVQRYHFYYYLIFTFGTVRRVIYTLHKIETSFTIAITNKVIISETNCHHTCTCFVPFYHQELLSELNISKVLIGASRKPRIVQHGLLQKIQPLLTDRESLFQKCQPISYNLAHKLLLSSYKVHSGFGCWDPIQVDIF